LVEIIQEREMDLDVSVTMAIDPVCGMEVDKESTPFRLEHDGVTYYFCSRGCMLDFQENPEKFLDPDHEPEGMGGG
jgi:YHS domain-containing protein